MIQDAREILTYALDMCEIEPHSCLVERIINYFKWTYANDYSEAGGSMTESEYIDFEWMVMLTKVVEILDDTYEPIELEGVVIWDGWHRCIAGALLGGKIKFNQRLKQS